MRDKIQRERTDSSTWLHLSSPPGDGTQAGGGRYRSVRQSEECWGPGSSPPPAPAETEIFFVKISQRNYVLSRQSSHLQHFLLVDDGLPPLRSEEERCPPEPLVGVPHQSLADLQEGGPLVRDNVPTLGHQVEQNVRAVVWPLHLVSLLDVLHDLRIVFIHLLLTNNTTVQPLPDH